MAVTVITKTRGRMLVTGLTGLSINNYREESTCLLKKKSLLMHIIILPNRIQCRWIYFSQIHVLSPMYQDLIYATFSQERFTMWFGDLKPHKLVREAVQRTE